MGSASSKFKKYLQHGDEFAAMQVFQSSGELRKSLDPNVSYGEAHAHNTPLHYAARHGMKHLLRTFVNDMGGNPNKRNALNETALHAACQLPPPAAAKSCGAHERRAACVALLLQWKGVRLANNSGDGQDKGDAAREKIDLNAQDQNGNTALHWAASTGLRRCVELLIAQPASALFMENNDKLTPCDLAMKNNHHDIARLLEARMVFADTVGSDTVNEDELAGTGSGDQEEVYSGLRTQDLQEAKDQLLVETSDMLHIPLFTAEALLRDNEWSRETLLEKWMLDPVQCCQLAGVQAPASALQHFNANFNPAELASSTSSSEGNGAAKDMLCEICLSAISQWDLPTVQMSCKHAFCNQCWEKYLNVKIQEGDAHHILCPAYQCHILVPVELIERLVTPEMARRYLQFDIKAFVETNKSIKWCPVPGCGRAVRLPEQEQYNDGGPPLPTTSHAVDCGNSHFFCWECLGDAHAPCGCDQWTRWHAKISEIKPEELKTSCSESEDAANCLWLVTNSKPCPNCKSPIQKNEGCNHIKCSKCKFDFCWICQESWKRHSSATGGYFRCNRFEAVHKADEKQGTLITEAVVRNSQMEELSRFLHYYTRFRNHENSQRLEEPLLTGVRQKMELLASSLGLDSAEECGERRGSTTKFVEEGVRELLKARRVLCGSYVYGYYLEDNGYNKTIFEFMQNELEEVTEKLSEMIARPYLRTPKPVIVQTTALTRRKRHEFVRAVAKGLVPPETPPGSLQRKQRKRRFPTIMTLDQAGDQRTAVGRDVQEALIRELDPNNPWVKDTYGRHDNINSVYDWPAESGDAGDGGGDVDSPANRALAISVLGECRRTGCGRPRARNPRTGDLHQYCSLRCSKADQLQADQDAYRVAVSSDYNMDLVIALEMSRLQMIEDRMKQVTDIGQGLANVLETLGPSSQGGDPGTSDSCLLDDQLKLAIQLSLQESTAALNKQLQQQAKPVTSTATQAPDESTPDEDGCSCNNKLITECRDCLKHSTVKDIDTAYDDLYEKTSADLTVDYFLKSLANHKIDLKNIDMQGVNLYSPNNELDSNSSTEWNKSTDKDVPCFLKRGKEDGRFQIGDIHETGFINLLTDDSLDDDEDEFYDEQSSIVRSLKRSHSTGDLCARRPTAYRRAACARRLGFSGTVPSTSREPANRYHLDSDHSSNHDEMCEEVVKKMLALPAGKRHQLLHQHAALSPSDDPTLYQGQSSLEDTTTTSDSLNADMEVCGILDHSDEIMPDYTTDGDDITLVIDEQNTIEQNTVPEKEHLAVDCTANNMGTFKLTTYKKSPKLLRNLKTRGAQNTTSSSSGEWGRSTTKSPPPAEEKRRSEATSETPSSGGSSKMLINPLACLKAKLCSAHLPKANARSKIAINRSIGLLRDKKHKQQYAGSYSGNDTSAKQCGVYDKSTKQTNVYPKCDNTDNKKQTTYPSDSNKQKNKKQEKHVIVYTSSDTSTSNKQCSVYSTCDNSPEYNNSDKKQCIYDNSNYEKSTKILQKAKQQVYSETKMCAVQKSIVKSAKVVPEPGLYIDKHVTIDKHLTIDTRKMSLASNKDTGGIESLQESHRKAFKLSGGKTVSQNLRIRICKSPTPQTKLQATSQLQVDASEPKQLETDSSNEYESETGIPKSPTLYISGVSISRTPEPPKSPGTGLVALAAALSGRQTRSSSLTVPAGTVATQTINGNGGGGVVMTDALRVSNSSLNVPGSPEPYTPSLTRSMTPVNRSKTPSPQKSPVLLLGKENCPSGGANNNKSKSASEPEREREMFRFPKSSTDGALSSVLHVQESNLSSDDFHEALFLLERSPKTRDSKRRKKAKKKDKDNNNIGDCCGASRTEEASSVL